MIFSVTLSCDASHQKILTFGNISDLLLILINFDKNAYHFAINESSFDLDYYYKIPLIIQSAPIIFFFIMCWKGSTCGANQLFNHWANTQEEFGKLIRFCRLFDAVCPID